MIFTMFDVISITEHFHYIGIFILLVIGGMGFPIPEGVTLMASGFLISHEVIKPIPTIVIVFTGMLTGDITIFSIGRKYGRMVVTHRIIERIGKEAKKGTVTLLFAAKDAEHNNAVVLKEIIEEAI